MPAGRAGHAHGAMLGMPAVFDRGKNMSKGWARVVALVVVLATGHAQAQLRAVPPGEIPELRDNEGLVVVAVDTDIDLYRVRLTRNGRMFGSGTMQGLGAGRNHALYVATEGDYEWADLWLIRQIRYPLRKDPEFAFSVSPGTISYPGDLLFRPLTPWRAQMQMYNRGLAAMDWLEDHHPGLLARYGMVYTGHYPDPFPAFYLQQHHTRGLGAAAAQTALRTPPEAGVLPLPVETAFRSGRILNVRMNPAGSLIALHVREDEEEWTVELVDLEAGTLTVMATSASPFVRMEWSGDQTLVVTARPSRRTSLVSVIRIEEAADGGRGFSHTRLPEGVVVSVLPGEPDHILYATRVRHNSTGTGGQMMVHRMDISSAASIEAFQPTLGTRLNRGLQDDSHWLVDAGGRLRAAIVQRGEGYVLVHGEAPDFQDLLDLSEDSEFDPVALSADASLIFGVTEHDRGQRELVAFDVAQRRIVRTLFSREGVDVDGVLLDARQEPIGVTYYEGGRLVSTYFSEADDLLAQRLRQAFDGHSVRVVARNADRSQVVAWVEGGNRPGELFHVDVARGSASFLAEDRPWLADTRLARTEVVRFNGADGLAMEAFLTLPEAAGRRPLVVYPHGGPVGVADTLDFRPDVQFLASLGYAVLRVNFRGSDGYGRAFREAGRRNWGTVIEDDIDAALTHVLEHYPIDATRMCALGSSYGGYSALISAIRWPDRFRCVVSFAGVSDPMLVFTASDTGRDPRGRQLLEQLIGDPHTEASSMTAASPLLNAGRLSAPVMLAHGLEDRRADFEHSHRLARLLHIADTPAVGLVFEAEGHGLSDPDNVHTLWRGIAGFLREHLD